MKGAMGSIMNDSRTYVGAAVFFERPSDDGWTEGNDGWPERIEAQAIVPNREKGRLRTIRNLLRIQFVSLLNRDHT